MFTNDVTTIECQMVQQQTAPTAIIASVNTKTKGCEFKLISISRGTAKAAGVAKTTDWPTIKKDLMMSKSLYCKYFLKKFEVEV